MTRNLSRLGYRNWAVAVLAVACLMTAVLPLAASTPITTGYEDFSFPAGTSGNSRPTGEKPQSKLWFNDTLWWAVLWNTSADAYRIYYLNEGTQSWVDIGTSIDTRNDTKSDALWDAASQKLYVLSHVWELPAAVGSSSERARLYRYSYSTSTQSYSLDSGFPVDVSNAKTDSMVLEKDSTGRLWVTYTLGQQILMNASDTSDSDWDPVNGPFVVPVGSTADVQNGDLSSIIAYSGNIGVLWSNQATDKMYFAEHPDGSAPESGWSSSVVVFDGGGNQSADNHVNLKSLDGKVYAVTKTSEVPPRLMLLECGNSCSSASNWSSTTAYLGNSGASNPTRPIVLIDETSRMLYVLATVTHSAGQDIFYKETSVDSIQFNATALGISFIEESGDNWNNISSTKQNLTSLSGIAGIASTLRKYAHNQIHLSPAVQDIDVVPTSHDFGALALGGSASKVIVVENLGSLDLDVSATSLVGANPGQFNIASGGGSYTLAPGATRNVNVQFNPTSNGPKSVSLRIASDDPDEDPFDVPLTGTGGVAPDITVTPTSHDYGDKVVGTSATFNVEVRNDGSATLTVASTTLSGANPGQFSINSGGGAFSLAPAATRNIVVGFNPTSLGTKSVALQIVSDDPDESPLDVDLSGNGIPEPPPGVLLRQIETGGSASSSTVSTSANLTAVDGHRYLAAISSKSYRVVFDVTGLGLTWSEVESQCGGRSQTGVSLWTATGTLSAFDSPVTATLVSSPSEAVIVVTRYSGVEGLGNMASANSNGVSGACSGGVDGASYSVGLSTTVPNALVYSAAATRNKSHEPGAGYTEQVEASQGSGGSTAALAVQDRVFASPGAVIANGSLSGSADWAVAAVELRPQPSGPSPEITVSPLSHGYGNVALGQSGSHAFNVRNDGTADLSVTSTSLSGANPGQFSVTAGGGSFILIPGASRDIVVDFTPNSVGSKNASLDIASNDLDEALVQVSLTGTGTLLEPDITLSPLSHDYGNVVVGQSSSQSFTVTNDGTADLSVASTGVTGANSGQFSIINGGSFVLTPGASRNVSVHFSPTSVGNKVAAFEITSDDPDEPLVSASVSGTGAVLEPDITVLPTSHNYGTVVLGQSSSNSFNVKNDGTSSLSVTSTILTGANDFAITSGGGSFVLSPGASRDIFVSFSPSSVGTKVASLEISSDDPDEAVVSISLSGLGSDAPPPGVVLEENQSGGASSSATVSTASGVTSVNDHVYLAAITSKRSPTVVSVTGMGLVWTKLREQCGGRNQTGASLWTATAGPSGFNGVVTATLADSVTNAMINVVRYSGVNQLGNLASANTNGVSGSCSGGADSPSYSLPLTTTVADALVYGVVSVRHRTHTAGSGFTEQVEVSQGSGGNTSGLAVVDQIFASPGAVNVAGSISGSVDWAVIAVELQPGAAVPAPDITVSPLSHAYGNVVVGQSAQRIFNVKNDGTLDLSVSATTLTGANTNQYGITGGGAFVLIPGESRNITVTFNPTSVGQKLAALEITSNDSDESLVSVDLSGTGAVLEPDITVSPSSYDYGAVVLLQSSAQTFNVRNDGTSNLSVTSTTLTGPNPGQFSITSGGGSFTLVPGENRDISVTFTPTSLGSKVASLDLSSNDPDEALVSIGLTGTGSDTPPAGVELEQIESGGSASSATVATASPLTSVNGHVYLASVTSKRSPSVASVTGMGLVWTELRTQCGGRSQTGISLWTATGTAGSFDGAVTATLSESVSNAVIAVARYSGVGQLGNLASANTNGVSGACSGGSDSSSYTLGLSTTVPDSVVHGVVALRNKSHNPGAGYTEQAEVSQGGGGTAAALAIETRLFASPGAVIVNGSLSGSVDWAVVAIELRP